jgi:chromosome segregation ATPase
LESVSTSAARDALSRISEFESQKLAALNDRKAEYDRHMKDLTAQLDFLSNHIELLKQEHGMEMDSATQALKRNKDESDQTIADLLAQIEELRMQLSTQVSRPDDVAQIDFLTGELCEKNDTIAKLFTQLKHYQGELVNRESAYNKTFNARPNVGVLNVIERKVKRDNLVVEATLPLNLPPLLELADASGSRPTSVRRRQNSATPKSDRAPSAKRTV